MAKDNLSSKELILIVVSAVLSAFMSVFVYVLYQENNEILTNPSTSILTIIFIQAVIYLFFIAILHICSINL
ncbi:hypothetical protein CMO83_03845 [Candidatus Woesearchaeota archaeon]|jgi:hypothetical protein|nr:hypothetical protein [Candidatus Woesearchaeota archaeon]MAG91782.1 hypothetical protein [Candidatus Woesearchaeota archaeon]|tara:strand:+ start:29589 stop:29804 length:216 start_codon:yes stop_codon:yes gene_type:complete